MQPFGNVHYTAAAYCQDEIRLKFHNGGKVIEYVPYEGLVGYGGNIANLRIGILEYVLRQLRHSIGVAQHCNAFFTQGCRKGQGAAATYYIGHINPAEFAHK